MKKTHFITLVSCLWGFLLAVGTVGAQVPAKHVDLTLAANFDWSPETDAFAKYLETENNVKITIMKTDDDPSNMRQQSILRAASGGLPTVFQSDLVENNVALFWKWVDQGIIRSIPEALINKYPTIKKNFEASPWAQGIKKMKGKYYGIPTPSGSDPIFDQDIQAVYYRADWARKAGITKAPVTVADFYTLLKKTSNPKAGIYGLTMQGYPFLIHCWWGIDPESWIQENGRWIPARISDRNIEALKFMQRLYQEKLLDQEFFNNNVNMVLQKIASDKFGALYKQADSYWAMRVTERSYLAAHQGMTSPEAASRFAIIPYLVAKAGDKPFVPPNASGTFTVFSSKATDDQVDRWLQIAEWTKKEVPRRTIRYGFLGKDVDLLNGELVRRKDEDDNEINPRDNYPSTQIANYVDYDADIHLTDTRWGKEARKLGIDNLRARYPFVVKENFQPRLFDLESIRKNPSLLNMADLEAKWTKIITTNGDVAKAFHDWVNASLKLGLQKIIDDVNVEMRKYQ